LIQINAYFLAGIHPYRESQTIAEEGQMLALRPQEAPGDVTVEPRNSRIDQTSDTTAYDASLLFRRMKLHQIDRTYLAENDPLLFRQMQALCTLCQSKERCVGELDGTMSEGWPAYCLNARTLIALGEQPQKMPIPRRSGDAPFCPQQYYYVGSKSGVVPHWWAESASHIPRLGRPDRTADATVPYANRPAE
jgi:hypothetical protein